MSESIFDAYETDLLPGETMIEANAGTGKTYTLCRIVERLILDHEIPIERILAVTFTNAAADELRERIRQNLRDKRNSLKKEEKKKRHLLNRALSNFDDARLFTLHAFCKRLLSEFSFECGVRPESELIADQSHLLKEVALDFRRINFSNCTPFCSALSFTGNLTTAGLQEVLGSPPEQEPDEDKESLSPEEFEALVENSHTGYRNLVHMWNSEAKDIKDFLENSAKNGSKPRNKLPELDRRFRHAFENHESNYPDFALIKLLRSTLSEEIEKKPSSNQEKPAFFKAAFEFCTQCEKIENHLLDLFLVYGKQRLEELKSMLNLRTFGDLQSLVAEGLEGERGKALVKKVFSQYDAALVDEFQDTDPLQFDILRKLFTSTAEEREKRIFYIGDPKQSIYKFRGADLNNYLDIREGVDKAKIHSLVTNYRTHPKLVEATNVFLTSKFKTMNARDDDENLFMDKRIAFRESRGSELKEEEAAFRSDDQDLATAPFSLRYAPKADKKETAKQAEKKIITDLTGEILALLDREKKPEIGNRPVRGSDLAVLCRTNEEADAVLDSLTKHEIPCVLLANRSIFKTEEAKHMKYLLEALLSPTEIGKVRRVLVLPFFSLSARQLKDLESDPVAWDYWGNRFSTWAQLWATHGFSYAFQTILNDDLQAGAGQENELQPIPQKILSEKGGERRITNYFHLGEILYQAEQSVSSTFPRNLYLWYVQQMETNVDVDESDARLESDEDAVKILTIHKAKGLEFPITFVPFCWKTRRGESKEDKEENMRMLYVALTRASSRLYLYVRQPGKDFAKCCLSRCLPENVELGLEELRRKPEFFDVRNVGAKKPEGSYLAHEQTEELEPLEFSGNIPSGYVSSSFSQKTKGEDKDKDSDDDEPETKVIPPQERKGAHAFPAGTKAGNFFHDVFENIDFKSTDHSQTIATQLRKHGLAKGDPKIAHEIIAKTLNTPLDKHSGAGVKLSEIPDSERIAEMEFHLRAPDFSLSSLGDALLAVEPENHFANYLSAKKDDGTKSSDLSFFKGFIDLTFRHQGKYFILDWKSNLLSGEQSSFASAQLPHAMAHSNYLLQYHLYGLALHRFLKQTIGNEYEYEDHFGGAYYLFVRGMHKPAYPDDGIFFDCPSEKLIERMDQYFMEERIQSHE